MTSAKTIEAIIDELRENGREQTFAEPEEAAALHERERALYDEAAALGYCWQAVSGLLVTLICDSIATGLLPDGTPGY